MRVTLNSSPMCLECGRILMLQPVGDGKNCYFETPLDEHCTNRCLTENAGKKFRAPIFDCEELSQ